MQTSVIEFLETTISESPDKEAIFCGDASLTFSQLHQQALGTSQVLQELGFKKGDRVGIRMNKSLDQVIAILGTLYANAVFVPILPQYKKEHIFQISKDADLSGFISDSKLVKDAEGISKDLRVMVGHGPEKQGYPHLPSLREEIEKPSFFNCNGSDNAAILFSSGSTGQPKGIVLSHNNLVEGTHMVASYLQLTNEDRVGGILSLNFDYGLNHLWQTLYKGSSLYLHELNFPNDLFNLIFEHKLTGLPVMPVLISRMFDPRFFKPDPTQDYSSIRFVCTTGGRVSEAMIQNLQSVFPESEVFLRYGSTEGFGSTYLDPKLIAEKFTSIGKAAPGVNVHVLDSNHEDCPSGIPGELVHRGKGIAKEYWNDPEATAQRFRKICRFPGETVVFSGDIVQTDDAGHLYFLGRKDTMIKTQGCRVSPTEIEEVADRYESVSDSMSFGVSNIEIGEDIVLVYATSNQTPINEPEFSRFFIQSLPRYMIPKYFVHLDHFPIGGNEGKIDQVKVKELALKQLGDRKTKSP